MYCDCSGLSHSDTYSPVEWRQLGTGGQSHTAHTGVQSTRQLTFSPLHTSHGAEYWCQAVVTIPAINVTRNSSKSITVTVQSKSL